jgi:hypothetical protein
MRFDPEVIRIKAGQTVTWEFDDGDIPHTVTAFDHSFDSGVLRNGSFTLRFDRPGEYCYQCVLHPGLNRCGQAAEQAGAGVSFHLTGGDAPPQHGAAPRALGGGGHMQGRVIVER